MGCRKMVRHLFLDASRRIEEMILTLDALTNILVYEPRRMVEAAWKNQVVRLSPGTRIKVVGDHSSFCRELNSSREAYTLIIATWDDVSQLPFDTWGGRSDEKESAYRRVASVRAHPRYKDAPICVYSQAPKKDKKTRLFFSEYADVLFLRCKNAPYGLLENIMKLLAAERDVDLDRAETALKDVFETIEKKDFKGALDKLSQVGNLPGVIVRKMALKLHCLLETGRIELAKSLLAALKDFELLTPSIIMNASRLHFKEGRGEEAVAMLQSLSLHFPDEGATRLEMVNILNGMGEHDRARQVLLSEVDSLSATKAMLYSELVKSFLRNGDYQELLTLADRSDFAISEDCSRLITASAVEVGRKGDPATALKILEKYLNFYPENEQWKVHYNCGRAVLEMGKEYGRAVDCFSRALMEKPDEPAVVKAIKNALFLARGENNKFSQDALKKAINKRTSFLNRKFNTKLKPEEEIVLNLCSQRTISGGENAAA